MGDLDLIPGLGRSPGEEKGYPLQYSDLENSTDYTVMGPQRVRHERLSLTQLLFHHKNSAKIYIYILTMKMFTKDVL